jgi:hypothetical protein
LGIKYWYQNSEPRGSVNLTTIIDERLFADFACLDPIYVDDMVGVLNLGANFNMLFYRWVPRANDGLITYDRSPALSLVLPRTSVLARDGVVASWLHGQPAPKELPAAADYRH